MFNKLRIFWFNLRNHFPRSLIYKFWIYFIDRWISVKWHDMVDKRSLYTFFSPWKLLLLRFFVFARYFKLFWHQNTQIYFLLHRKKYYQKKRKKLLKRAVHKKSLNFSEKKYTPFRNSFVFSVQHPPRTSFVNIPKDVKNFPLLEIYCKWVAYGLKINKWVGRFYHKKA